MTTLHFEPQSDADALAWEIAQAFHDEINLRQYRRICASHERSFIYITYKDVMSIPIDRVRKSRAAIFFHKIREYDTR